MMRCERCHLRMVGPDDIPGRLVCMACGHEVRDGFVNLVERMASNSKSERSGSQPHDMGPRQEPIEAPAEVMARVMAAIRAEAGR